MAKALGVQNAHLTMRFAALELGSTFHRRGDSTPVNVEEALTSGRVGPEPTFSDHDCGHVLCVF